MKIVPSVCCNDCGGSCPLSIYVDEGKIVNIEARDVGLPAFRPCARGLLAQYRVYAPDRLQYPMKRVGERGEGKFKRISWDDALSEIAEKLTAIRAKYGPASVFNLSWSGGDGKVHNFCLAARFLNMTGGQTTWWGGASFQGGYFGGMATYGKLDTGNERADLLNSKMILLWGCNPAESIFGTETRYYLTQAKEKGIRIVCVDPRLTETAATLAHQWIPIRPGTDAAMFIAMAYVIVEKGLQDQAFLDKYTVGFDMFRDYLTGEEEGIAKTPEWAEKITGVPAATIRQLAIEYATSKPAALLPGFAPGRGSRGEQYHRAAATLAAMTGNVGVHGGAAGGLDLSMAVKPGEEIAIVRNYIEIFSFAVPMLTNPVDKDNPPHEYAVKGIRSHTVDKVHQTHLWDAMLRGKAGGYYSDLKMLYVTNSNGLNQLPATDKGAQAIKGLEFVVVHDQFMTPTAKFADILLPVCTWAERNDIRMPWMFGHYALFANKAIEPLYESKSDFDIFQELGKKMGVTFSEKTEDDWLRDLATKKGIPDYEAFKATGFYKLQTPEPYVCFEKQIKDPEHYQFPTPSGKIEIFCQRIADFDQQDVLPAIPKYVEAWEGQADPKRAQYPLQLFTPHSRKRVHSQFHNVAWFNEMEPHAVWINPVDAKPRHIKNEDRVTVSNDRGTICLPAKVTNRIVPGVVCVYEGGWYNPDANGVDQGGCVNVLVKGEHSPGGAFCPNTVLVEVAKA
ncbi:MAG: molybdopterin-dependent oxidoreductase [Chloroflexi bacterium]|nr:molybdopterin-dependent oxidoreductase [Chloroflexota bacterium]